MLLAKLKVATVVSLTFGLVAASVLFLGQDGMSPAALAQDRAAVTEGGPKPAKGYAGLSDAEFIRKACLDIRGRVPSDIEVQYFLKDTSPGKRAWLLERLSDEAARASAWPAPRPGRG